MLIFNLVGAGWWVLGVITAWTVFGIGYKLGLVKEGGDWIMVIAASVTFLLDLTARARGWIQERSDALRFVMPGAGGHIFFIPCWLVALIAIFYSF